MMLYKSTDRAVAVTMTSASAFALITGFGKRFLKGYIA